MTKYLSIIYHASNAIVNMARDGYVRPTFAERFMSHKTYVPILSNLFPIAGDDSISLNKNGNVNVYVLNNDSDTDGNVPLTIQSVTQPSHGSVTISGDNLYVNYTPTIGYFGNDSFTYVVTDTLGGTSTGTVSVEVINTPTYRTLVGGTYTNLTTATFEYQWDCIRLSDTEAITLGSDLGASTKNLYLEIVDFSTSTPTITSSRKILWDSAMYSIANGRIISIDTNKFLVLFRENQFTNYYSFVKLVSLSGSTFTVESTIQLTDLTDDVELATLDTNKALMVYNYNNGGNYACRVRGLTVSGTTITESAAVEIVGASDSVAIQKINSTKAVVFTGNPFGYTVITFTGATPTASSRITGDLGVSSCLELVQIDTTHFCLCVSGTFYVKYYLLTWDGDYMFEFSEAYTEDTPETSGVYPITIKMLSDGVTMLNLNIAYASTNYYKLYGNVVHYFDGELVIESRERLVSSNIYAYFGSNHNGICGELLSDSTACVLNGSRDTSNVTDPCGKKALKVTISDT